MPHMLLSAEEIQLLVVKPQGRIHAVPGGEVVGVAGQQLGVARFNEVIFAAGIPHILIAGHQEGVLADHKCRIHTRLLRDGVGFESPVLFYLPE